MPKFLTLDEFARQALGDSPEARERPPAEPALSCAVRSAGSVDPDNSSGRLISYVLSDTSVGRDNHVVASDAWQLANFLRNPVMPWAHDTSAPPIAKWVDIASRGNRLVGTAEYADRDTYDFADTIFRLVKGGFLNAVSTSWLPLDWKFSTDRSRPGGIDFLKVDLLECSQVPVPALPSALVTARAAGIDTGPIVEWAERLLDSNNFAVLPRSELETLRREAKMPSSRRKNRATQPEPKVEPAPEAAPPQPAVKLTHKRSLSHVGWLAYLLNELGYLQDCTEYEAAIEEDGSAVPGDLLAAMKQLGQVLIAMTVEEVSELLAGDDEEDEIGDVVEMSSDAGVARQAFGLLRRLDAGALSALSGAMRGHLQGRAVTFKVGDQVAEVSRAGRVLSAENERCLREAHDHMNRALEIVGGVVDQVDDDDDDNNDDGAEARALRARRAAALKLRLATTA